MSAKQTEIHQCPHCAAQYVRAEALRVHIINHHPVRVKVEAAIARRDRRAARVNRQS